MKEKDRYYLGETGSYPETNLFGIPRTYSVAQLARLTGISRSCIYRDIEHGYLKALVPCGKTRGFRFREEEISDWMENRLERDEPRAGGGDGISRRS